MSAPEGVSTKARLAHDLEAAGAPKDMVLRALGGFYDDFDSPLATPMIQLVADARAAGLEGIAKAAMHGAYDGTREEGERWYAQKGHHLLGEK